MSLGSNNKGKSGEREVIVASTDTHCMGETLHHYIQPKIHPEIRDGTWSRIIVRGSYERKSPTKPADLEKRDKPFNWQRPTANEADDNTLILNCFPGQSYVRHYASLAATYLSITGHDPSIVECQLPTDLDCSKAFTKSNLPDMRQVDIVLLGCDQHLEDLVDGTWEGREDPKHIFAWKKHRSRNGQSIALLGCMLSFWGDTSGNLICTMKQLNGIKCFLYIGKAGSLCAADQPNKILATGDCSRIGERLVKWDNVLYPDIDLESSKVVAAGEHVTVQTPLCESQVWLQGWQPRCRWVDCEVGHMAEACNELGVEFGYLHVVSDNLCDPHPYNISNERLEAITVDRQKLFVEVRRILRSFLARQDLQLEELGDMINR